MLSFELTPIHKADFYNCVEANVTPFFFLNMLLHVSTIFMHIICQLQLTNSEYSPFFKLKWPHFTWGITKS